MIQIAFLLAATSSFVWVSIGDHFVIFFIACVIAYVMSDGTWNQRAQMAAVLFWSCLAIAATLLPISWLARRAAEVADGETKVRDEFIRMGESSYYQYGKEQAASFYTKAVEYAEAEKDLRAKGLCVTRSVTYNKPHYRLICSDGWAGSSCGCGGGRGCCSWHGGYGFCSTTNTQESLRWVDGISTTTSEGYVRIRACGQDRSSLRFQAAEALRSAERAIDNEGGLNLKAQGTYEWLLGWRDGAEELPDFEVVVLKDDTTAPITTHPSAL